MSEKKEELRKRLAEAGVELIRANEALTDATQNIGRLERQFQGLQVRTSAKIFFTEG